MCSYVDVEMKVEHVDDDTALDDKSLTALESRRSTIAKNLDDDTHTMETGVGPVRLLKGSQGSGRGSVFNGASAFPKETCQ